MVGKFYRTHIPQFHLSFAVWRYYNSRIQCAYFITVVNKICMRHMNQPAMFKKNDIFKVTILLQGTFWF